MRLNRISEVLWELPLEPGMRVPGRIYADAEMAAALENDQSLGQVANVAHLPGILCCSLAMPDIHFGYGFPIGGVAAFDVREGVVSPAEWVTTSTAAADSWPPTSRRPTWPESCPCLWTTSFATSRRVWGRAVRSRSCRGTNSSGWWSGRVLAVERGYGSAADLEHTEDGGVLAEADPAAVSGPCLHPRARPGGHPRLRQPLPRVQVVDEVFDLRAADAYGWPQGR